VFTLDTRGQEPKAYWGGYAVAKAGLSALLVIPADEWENNGNLRVNGVVPGPIRSPRADTPGDDFAKLPPPEALVPLYSTCSPATSVRAAESSTGRRGCAFRAGDSRSRYPRAARNPPLHLPLHFVGFFLYFLAALLDVLACARHRVASTEGQRSRQQCKRVDQFAEHGRFLG
jgi:NAD(P)-dependent dehydrogenase (short-subunit alcohol dehydrogenase family)